MSDYKYVNMARGDLKPDGAVVGSFYYDDSKDKKEHFRNAARMKKSSGSSGNGANTSRKKRTIKVSKSVKEKYRDKNRVEGYLQYNSWEYVLRVPVTSVDHQTTWKKFKERYGYKHKDRPLQYVMVKGDGELYGAISNAPVENGKIPLVNVEHYIVSAFDQKIIKQLTGLSLQYKYKGKEHSYVSSNGLNKKRYKYIELGNVWEVKAPEGALKTKGQLSLVFSSGTTAENMARFKQCADAISRGDMEMAEMIMAEEAEKSKLKEYIESGFDKKFPELTGNIEMVIFNDGYIEKPKEIKYNYRVEDGFEIATAYYNGYEILEQVKAVGTNLRAYTYPHTQYYFPYVYFIINLKNSEVYYVGQTREPLKRYCQHFGIHKFKPDKKNNSPFYQYITETFPADKWQEEFDKYTMLFIPLLKYEIDGKIVKYLPRFSDKHISDDGKIKTEIEMAEARFQEIILKLEKRGVFTVFRKNGRPLFHQKGKKRDSLVNYEINLSRYKAKYGTENDPMKMCFKNALDRNKKYDENFSKIEDVLYTQRVTELADMDMQPKEVQGFLKEYLGKRYEREDEILGLSVVSSAIMRYGSGVNVDDAEKEMVEAIMHWTWQNNKLECGEVGKPIGRGTWGEDGKTVTRLYCYAVDGCIGKMQPTEYPCFNGKECKCLDISESQTVFSDEPEQP